MIHTLTSVLFCFVHLFLSCAFLFPAHEIIACTYNAVLICPHVVASLLLILYVIGTFYQSRRHV